MIEELLHFLSLRSAGATVRRLGYAYEAAALQTRHRRCRAAWQSHVDASRQALLRTALAAAKGGTGLIIGGGISQDLPLDALLNHFQQLILLDVVFSPQTRRLAKRWSGRLHVCYGDVTGCIDWLAEHKTIPADDVAKFVLPNDLPPLDWIASVNCWTQLPLLPAAWLRRYGCDETAVEHFAHSLLQAHLDGLMACACPVCLITEVDERTVAAASSEPEIHDWRPLLQPWSQHAELLSQWLWQLHPAGELAQGQRQTRTVQAWLRPTLPRVATL